MSILPITPSGHARGGSAVIIKKSLHHYDVGVFITTSIQSSVVAINFNNCTVHLGSIYCPPRVVLVKKTYLNLFHHLGHNFILGGDLNAKHPIWYSRITSQRGRVLHQAIVVFTCESFLIKFQFLGFPETGVDSFSIFSFKIDSISSFFFLFHFIWVI
jgi:hypothetical protein